MRRFTTFSSTSAAFVSRLSSVPNFSSALRTIVVYTPQSSSLVSFQNSPTNHANYTQQMWLEEEDWGHVYNRLGWAASRTKIKPGQEKKSVKATIVKTIDYYNVECVIDQEVHDSVQKLSETVASFTKGAALHYSVRGVKSPLKSQDHLDSIALMRGYQSKFWILASEVRKRRLRLINGSKVSTIPMQVLTNVWNVEQFEEPEKVIKTPIFAFRKKPFNAAIANQLTQHMEEQKFTNGLYFTTSNLELYNLRDAIKAGAKPAIINHTKIKETSREARNKKFVSVFDLENYEEILQKHRLEKLQGNISDEYKSKIEESVKSNPHFLFSGKEVTVPKTILTMQYHCTSNNYPEQFWVSLSEVDTHKFVLKKNSLCVDLATGDYTHLNSEGNNANVVLSERAEDDIVEYYNVEQLEDPSQGFLIAGTVVPQS